MYQEGTEIDSSRAKYPTSQDGIHNAGFVDATGPEPPLIWIDGVLSMDEAEGIKSHQRVNKIPCMDYICFKSTLFEELNNMRRKFPQIVNFYPPTYLLPQDYPEFQRQHHLICGRTSSAPTWVIKPRSGSCGRGIFLIQSAYEASNIEHPAVAQLMVDPLLLDGFKFDFRFFLLVSSLEPFTAFIYKEGITRICTEPYAPPTKATRDRAFMNLTNTAVNVGSSKPPEEFTQPASAVLEKLARQNPSARRLWDEIMDCSRMLLASIYPTIMATLPNTGGRSWKSHVGDQEGDEDGKSKTRQRPTSSLKKAKKPAPEKEETEKKDKLTVPQRFFQILGIDIIIDSNFKPQVLELNDRPSLSVTVPFEKDLKTNLIREMFYHISSDGTTLGEHPESKWQQILPCDPQKEVAQSVKRCMATQSNIKYIGRIAADSPTTNRMLKNGINQELHAEHRQRANALRESAKAPRFQHYLKSTRV